MPIELVAYALIWYVVDAANPVRLLENTPVPAPSEVLASAIVGLTVILQHTPRSVTTAPPSPETFPPLVALVDVVAEIVVVVTIGTTIGWVVKVISDPYAVPIELVAYALTW